ISFTSFLRSCALTALNCFDVWRIGVNLNGSGMIGKYSSFHSLYSLPYPSGSACVTRWPSAHVTIYFWPSKKPLPFLLQPSTRAISLATDGFSANTTDLDMNKSPFCILLL